MSSYDGANVFQFVLGQARRFSFNQPQVTNMGIFPFAGLYESRQPRPDTWQRTFTIITTGPTHGRDDARSDAGHPPEERVDDWLFQGNESDALRALLAPARKNCSSRLPCRQR